MSLSNDDIAKNGGVGQMNSEKLKRRLHKYFGEHIVDIKLPWRKDFNDMLLDDGIFSIGDWYKK